VFNRVLNFLSLLFLFCAVADPSCPSPLPSPSSRIKDGLSTGGFYLSCVGAYDIFLLDSAHRQTHQPNPARPLRRLREAFGMKCLIIEFLRFMLMGFVEFGMLFTVVSYRKEVVRPLVRKEGIIASYVVVRTAFI